MISFGMVVAMLWSAAWAAPLELALDARSVELGQVIGVSVVVSNASPKGVPTVLVENGVNLAYQQQVANSYWMNGKSSRTVKFRYALTPLREGDFTIGPARVEVDGKMVSTGVETIHVAPRSAAQQARLEVDAGFDTATAWEGQVVLYRYLLRSRVQVLGSRWNSPNFEGLVHPRDGNQPRKQYTVDDPSGQILVDETWVPWVATGPGQHEYAGAVAQVDLPVERGSGGGRRPPFGDLFGMYETRNEVFAASGSTLNVSPLPPPPPGFSGLVGDFEFDSTVSAQQVPVGGSIEWTLTVRGSGTLEGFAFPKLGNVEAARIYDGSPSAEAEVVDGEYRAEGHYSMVIVPTREGEIDLPTATIVYFSTSKAEYISELLPIPRLRAVSGGEGQSAVASFAQPGGVPSPRAPVDGVRPLRSSGWDRRWPLAQAVVPLLGLLGAPVLLLGGMQLGSWWRAVIERRRRKKILKQPTFRWEDLPKDPEHRLACFDREVRRVAASQPERAAAAVLLLDRLGRSRFGGEQLSEDFEAQLRRFLAERQ